MKKKPKGKLLIIGGSESKSRQSDQTLKMSYENKQFDPFEILKTLVSAKKHDSIEVITAASSVPDEQQAIYKKAFTAIGYKHLQFMYIRDRMDAQTPEFLQRVQKAHAVFFTGGDQFSLATILGATDLIALIHEKYMTEPDFIVAGTSAGAMAMPEIMLQQGENQEALLKGDVKTSSGFGFVNHCIIDTHFIQRGRIGRLVHAIMINPACTGIGLGEDTALLLTEGNKMHCLGSGMVVILDGKNIGHTNIAYAEEATPVFVENMSMHILSNGNEYWLKERKFSAGTGPKNPKT